MAIMAWQQRAIREFSRDEIEQSIPARFEEQVRRYHNRLAVKTETEELTYDDLNKAANRWPGPSWRSAVNVKKRWRCFPM